MITKLWNVKMDLTLLMRRFLFMIFCSRFDKTEWMNEGEQEFDTLAGFVLASVKTYSADG